MESLEKEITELKSKNRTLKQQVEEKPQSTQPRSRAQIAVSGVQPQDPFIQAHIRELNGTIGKNLTVLRLGQHHATIRWKTCAEPKGKRQKMAGV